MKKSSRINEQGLIPRTLWGIPPSAIRITPTRHTLNLVFLLVLLLHISSGAQLRGQTIVVPNEFAEKDANTYNDTPSGSFSGIRNMVIFDSSQFGDLSGPTYLTRWAYRPDRLTGSMGPSSGTMKVFASTTKRSVAGLSTKFADNLGPDNTLVFEGTLVLTTSNMPGAGNTRHFDIVTTLTTPFLYDPAAGNLLLDVQISGGGGTSIRWDAITGNPSVRLLYANGSATVGSFGNVAVTQFTFEPAPVVTICPSQVEVCWQSISNATYRVEWQSEVSGGIWTPLADCVRSTDVTTCIQDALTPGTPRKFYRVVRTNCTP
jgi:hypothetical protein